MTTTFETPDDEQYSDDEIHKPLRFPKLASYHKFKFEHFSFALTVLTAFSVLYAFWEFENKLWNRVVYNVGQWEYGTPFYGDLVEYPTGEFVQSMVGNIIVMAISTFIFAIATTSLIFTLHQKGRSTRKTYMMLTGVTLVVCIATLWAQKSYLVSPKNWFPDALSTLPDGDWTIGAISLPLADSKALFVKSLLSFSVGIALSTLLLALVVDLDAILSHRRRQAETRLRAEKKPWTASRFSKMLILYFVMFGFLVYTLLPIVYTIFVSISSVSDLRRDELATDAYVSFIENYSIVIFTKKPGDAYFQRAFVLSVFLGVGTGIGGLTLSLPAAYALARYKFKSKKAIQFMVLATQMFPGIILLIPQYIIWSNLGLLEKDTQVFGVLLAYFVGSVAYTVWMMKGYFDTIPIDLEEAAFIDGCNEFSTFLRIALPLAGAGMAAVGIFTFLGAWNEFALAQIFIGEHQSNSTLPLLFYNFQDLSKPDNPVYYQLLAAYSMLVALPVMLLYLSLQRLIASGATAGGVK